MGMIERANDNLRQIYGAKHQDITLDDIEKAYSRNALSVNADAKTSKGNAAGYLTGIWYGAPAKLAGINTCPGASAGCIKSCLNTAGRGVFYSVARARVIKTLALFLDRPRYVETLDKSIKALKRKAKRQGLTPVVRLNGTTDIAWHRLTDLMTRHSDIQFYDYTKVAVRFSHDLPSNYDLTFSLTESNHGDALRVLQRGGRVAVVFRKDIPSYFWGRSVVDGDTTDLRFLDGQGLIVGLKAKGKAKKDTSGFVQDAPKRPAITQKVIINYIDNTGHQVHA